jgi:tripartite-type tricarboxylate transporter receptor subunit TctC
MTSLRRLFLSFALIAATIVGALPAQAQQPAWPSRPVRFIIPLGAGSGVDISARLLADKLSQ